MLPMLLHIRLSRRVTDVTVSFVVVSIGFNFSLTSSFNFCDFWTAIFLNHPNSPKLCSCMFLRVQLSAANSRLMVAMKTYLYLDWCVFELLQVCFSWLIKSRKHWRCLPNSISCLFDIIRGVYDHTGLRSERIKILRGVFGNSGGTLEGIKYRETCHICLTNISLMTALVAFNVALQSFCLCQLPGCLFFILWHVLPNIDCICL